MKRMVLVAVLLLFLISLPQAQNEAAIRIQKQTIEYLKNDSLHIELTLLLLIPSEYLEFLPSRGESIPYEIHMILKSQSGSIAGIKQIHRTLQIPPHHFGEMLVDSLQVSFWVKKDVYRISILPLDFPIYIKAIRDFPLQTVEKEKLSSKESNKLFVPHSNSIRDLVSNNLTI